MPNNSHQFHGPSISRLLFLIGLLTMPNLAMAAEGFMVTVTADPGHIKSGNEILAKVPKGTRLWAFEEKDGQWAKVKVPGKETKGWLYARHYQQVVFNSAQRLQLEQSYQHYNQYKKLLGN